MILFAYYLLKVVICSGILLLYYWLALRNRLFHQWNRFYLLASVLLALLLPLIQINIKDWLSQPPAQVEKVLYFVSSGDAVVVSASRHDFSFSTSQWIMLAYGAVSLVLLVWMLLAAQRVLKIIGTYPKQQLHQFWFLNTSAKGSPFTFLNYIIWNHQIDPASKTGQQVLRHELAHVQQKHTLDKIFLLLILIPFWINPFFWLIRKELHVIHEFLADEKAIEENDSSELAQMILSAAYPQQAFLFTNHFFQSVIKRRIHMFNKLQSPKFSYASRILVLPLFAIVFAAFTLKAGPGEQSSSNFQQPPQKQNGTLAILDSKSVADTLPSVIFTKVEQEPKFPGNNNDWLTFLQQNLKVTTPVDRGAPAGTYTVVVQFIVDKNGKVLELKPLTTHGYGMEEEVVRVMELSPDWKPARQNGRIVAAYKKQPVTFVISEE